MNTGNRFVETQDPLNRTTHTDLNEKNRPVRVIDSANQQAIVTYDLVHSDKPKTVTDPKGHVTQFRYDAAGRTTKVIDNAGNSTTFTYNLKGQVLTATDAMGNITQFAYNTRNDLVSITDPLGKKTIVAYDVLSRPVKITDPKGNNTILAYNVLDQLTSTTDALNRKTTYSYDANGNKVSETDPKGLTTTFSYDAKNRLISSTNARGETYSYQYDGADNLVSVTDPKGQTTLLDFDAADRLSKITFGDNTQYEYTYDAADQTVSISDGTDIWGFTYDLLGRVTVATSPQGTVNYTYDPNGNVTQLSSPSYGTVSYTYDKLDRPTSITKDGKTYSYNYDSLSRRTALNRPNGVTTTSQYDKNSQLKALTTTKGSSVLDRHEYTYDANGNIVKYIRGRSISPSVAGSAQDKAETLERNYTYDALNHLTNVNAFGIVMSASNFSSSANRTSAYTYVNQARLSTTTPQMRLNLLKKAEQLGAVLPESASWTFDANGNLAKKVQRTTSGDKTTTYTYDSADRLISVAKPTGTVTMSYDANGNLMSDSTGRQLTWNAQDQLTQFRTPGFTASFGYDPLGRRTRYTKGSSLKTYFYNGLTLLSDGSSRFLNGAGLDEPLQADTSTGSVNYLTDHLGSTAQLRDASNGSSKLRYDYNSYGKLEGNLSNGSLSNSYTYTGREDDGTGLMYYRARYYDPELEVFISQDPLGDAQRYVGGNPLGYADPLGLEGFNGFQCPAGVVYDKNGTPICRPIVPVFDSRLLVEAVADLLGVRSCGSIRNLENLESLTGAKVSEVEALIPKGWTKLPLKKGEGTRYLDPVKKGDAIMIQKGNPLAGDPLHSGPYMKISRNGQVTRIPLQGNPVLRNRFEL